MPARCSSQACGRFVKAGHSMCARCATVQAQEMADRSKQVNTLLDSCQYNLPQQRTPGRHRRRSLWAILAGRR